MCEREKTAAGLTVLQTTFSCLRKAESLSGHQRFEYVDGAWYFFSSLFNEVTPWILSVVNLF